MRPTTSFLVAYLLYEQGGVKVRNSLFTASKFCKEGLCFTVLILLAPMQS